jgi:hypothetical protein
MSIELNGTTGVTFPDGFTQASALATPISIANGGTGLGTIGANNTVLTSNGTSASWVAAAGGQAQSQLFASSGSWTCPAGVTRAKITVFGGGGGGTFSGCDGKGGLGGVGWNYFTVTPGTTYTVTIGAGGAGVTTGTSNAGGTTSFGALISATGGGSTNGGADGINGSCANSLVLTTVLTRFASTGIVTDGGCIFNFIGSFGRQSTLAGLTWSASSTYLPGAGGWPNNPSASGGVGGVALVEYIG